MTFDVNQFNELAQKYNLSGDQYSIFWALAAAEVVEVTAVPRALMVTYVPEVFTIRPFSRFGLFLYQVETENGPALPPLVMDLEGLAAWAAQLIETKRPRPQARGLS
jgi:hypothetical protein